MRDSHWRPLTVGLLGSAETELGLLARVLDRAGQWRCAIAGAVAAAPREPPDWDVVLVERAFPMAPREASECFGVSGPVIMVVADSQELIARMKDVDEADAFVTETVDPLELLVRVRSALIAHRKRHVVRAGVVHFDTLQHVVAVRDQSFPLTSGESIIFGCLARAAGRWWRAAELLEGLGVAHQTCDPVWQHISRIRQKLGALELVIESSHSLGYRLNPCAAPSRTQRVT
jgi:DNA-binding response OmpR family regulator